MVIIFAFRCCHIFHLFSLLSIDFGFLSSCISWLHGYLLINGIKFFPNRPFNSSILIVLFSQNFCSHTLFPQSPAHVDILFSPSSVYVDVLFSLSSVYVDAVLLHCIITGRRLTYSFIPSSQYEGTDVLNVYCYCYIMIY